MTAIDHEVLVAMLDRLKLTAIRDQLDTLLDEAARSKMTLREALGFFIQREITRRDERRISMASKIAQFPFVRELAGFEFDAQPSLDPGQIRELATCRWIAHGDTTLLLGPPGTGKLHLAVNRALDMRQDPEQAWGAKRSGRTIPCSCHRRHPGRHAGQGSWRWIARQAADAAEPAETADHRRARLPAVRGQCRAPVLPAGVAQIRERVDPDHLEPVGR